MLNPDDHKATQVIKIGNGEIDKKERIVPLTIVVDPCRKSKLM